MLRPLLASASALAALWGTAACHGPMDPLDLVVQDVAPDIERPELSVLPNGTVRQRYLVQVRPDLFEEGFAPEVITELVIGHDLPLEEVYTTVYGGFAASLTDAQLAALRARPDVESIVADQRIELVKRSAPAATTTATTATTDWGLVDVLGSGYDTEDAGKGVNVIVLDTGIDTNHPYLPEAECLGDFTRTKGTCEDDNGHGTHVSGTIAALPSSGHAGLAPGVNLGAAKVLSATGAGSMSGIVAAINAAARDGWDVINMSFAGTAAGAESTDPLCRAIQGAASLGVTSVVAAGNSARDASTASPARCDSAFTVAAHDVTGRTSGFSNYGADVDISAPGSSIYSTTFNGGFGRGSGTSMAAPHAAAVAARFLDANPDATPAQVRAGIIANSADRRAPLPFSSTVRVSAWKLDGRD